MQNSTVGPFRFKKHIIKSSALNAPVWANHAHLCNVVIFIRPRQKRICESQSRNALKQRDEGRQRVRKASGHRMTVVCDTCPLPADPGQMRRVWEAERGRRQDWASPAVVLIYHTSGSTWCYTSPAPGPWFFHYNVAVTKTLFSLTASDYMGLTAVKAGQLLLPAVGDFTDDVKRFFEVDSVRNYLQRQSDISIPRCLIDNQGQKENKHEGIK